MLFYVLPGNQLAQVQQQPQMRMAVSTQQPIPPRDARVFLQRIGSSVVGGTKGRRGVLRGQVEGWRWGIRGLTVGVHLAARIHAQGRCLQLHARLGPDDPRVQPHLL